MGLRGREKVKAVREAPTMAPVDGFNPWERLPKESPESWAGFQAYRDTPPRERSVRATVAMVPNGPTIKSVGATATRWRWVERAVAWDREMDRVRRETALAEVAAMSKRHTQLSLLKQKLGSTALRKLLALEEQSAVATIEGEFAAKLIEEGIRAERLARGEPESVGETRTVPDAESMAKAVREVVHDYSKLSKDELRALKALVGKTR